MLREIPFQYFWDLGHRGNSKAFGAGSFATEQLHVFLAHLEQLGQKLDQVLISLAIHRRRSNADLESIAMQADDVVSSRSRLDVAVEDDAVTHHFNGRSHSSMEGC